LKFSAIKPHFLQFSQDARDADQRDLSTIFGGSPACGGVARAR
jgi:hypothetical protein